jgi:hypothetical protein
VVVLHVRFFVVLSQKYGAANLAIVGFVFDVNFHVLYQSTAFANFFITKVAGVGRFVHGHVSVQMQIGLQQFRAFRTWNIGLGLVA